MLPFQEDTMVEKKSPIEGKIWSKKEKIVQAI